MAVTGSQIGRAAAWFKRRAAVVLALGIGIGIGIAIRYPTGWALPDNTASMFGSLIGAFATAAAVVLGIELQAGREDEARRRDQAELRMRAKIMLQPMLANTKRTYEDLVSNKEKIRDDASKNLGLLLASGLERIRSRILMEELDNEGLVGLSYIEIYISTLAGVAKHIAGVMPAFESRAGRMHLDVQRSIFADTANMLVDEIFKFAGGDSLEEWKIPHPKESVAA